MKILGMDIGGSGIKAAIVDTKTGKLISDRHRIATPNPATPEAITKVVKEMITHFNWEKAVGCSFPTTIIDGKCIHSGNLSEKWKNIQVDDYFEDACNVPFYISNDADLAGLAEITLGAGKGKKRVGFGHYCRDRNRIWIILQWKINSKFRNWKITSQRWKNN